MDTLDQLQAKLDKILNPSMPEPIAIPEVKSEPINPIYYQIAAGMGNNSGAASMSPIEKDLRTLTPNQLYAKYGQEQADMMLGQLALASSELQRNNLAERSWGETAWDSTTGAGNAFFGGLGGIAAWGAGKVDAETGVALSDVVESLRKFTEENQSDALNARRKVGAIKDSLTQRDSDAQYNLDIKNGDSTTAAGFNQFTGDIGNSSVFGDSTLLAQGVADAIGSFMTAYPVGAAIKGAAKLLVPKATARGIGLSGAMDAELGKLTVNRALSNADKLVWPAAIGTLESGGTYQQTVEDATNTLQQQGKTVGDKLELINDTAQQAADRMFLPAAGLGTITRFGEKLSNVRGLKQGAINILGREAPEEAGQGLTGTLLSNQAIQDNIDPNRKLGEGAAQATVQGAVYGSLAAGVVQAPGIAKQSMISAAKATLGYVDKRTALAAEKADDASPVGTKALKEKASSLVPNSEPVKQNLATELAGTDLTPEEKDQGIKYANDLVDSLKVSVENEFSDITPELSAIISGSEHRIDAIQQLGKKVITTSDPNEKLLTAATLYQLLQPILDLQTNRPSSVDNLSSESQAVLKDYESLIANVNNSPTIKNAMKQIHEIMVAQGDTVISPVLEEELNTPTGKQKVQSIITAANIAPDQGNLDATESIMKHAKEGKLNLTPEQTKVLNSSITLLRARKELEEKNKQFGLNASDIVSSEILTDRGVKDNNARSATQYTQEILSAVRRGNTLGATQLLYDMGLFVQHMKNKVEAINKHYLSGDTSKGSYVPYKALLPATRQWVNSETNPKALYKGGFVNVASPESIKFAQGVELEHKILADVYNSLTEVFPDLGIDRIEPLQLEKGISGAIRRTTQEPTKPVVKEEPKSKVTEPDVKVVEPKVEDKPIVEIKSEEKPEPVTFTGKMTFAYGSNKRSDVESDTTFDAIKAGERTATTRYESDGKIDYWSKAKVGDIIEFSNKEGDIVRVEVTKLLTKLPLNTDGETWSKKEGWSIDYFNKNVKPKLDKAYQLEYKLIGKAEPKKAKTPDQSQVLTELNLSAKEIQDVTSDLKNLVSFETVNTNTNRQTAQLGSDYTYSGKTYEGQPIPKHIQAWMDAVNKALGTAFNSVLVQYYPANTKSGIGFHKDNEKDQFDTNQPVISLSIGQTIPFIVHEKLNTPVTFSLKSGDVFKFNGNKLHGIATQNHTGERYSLTLRQFHIVKVHKTTPPVSPEAVEEITHNPEMDSEINKGTKNYSPLYIRFGEKYSIVYAKPVLIPGYENIKFSIYKDKKGNYKIVEASTGMLITTLTGLRTIKDAIDSVKNELDKHSLNKIESILDKELTLNEGFDYVFTKQSEPIKQESIPVEPVVAKEVPVKQEQLVIDTKNKVDPKTFTNHSGGAKGYDAEWDIIGAEFGFINNNHYLLPVDGSVADPRLKAKGVKPVDASKDIGQVAATGPAIGEAQIAVTKAERAMGRIEKNHTTRNTKKIRNYAQVKNADGIFAIGSLIPKGADITIAQGKETRVALVPQVNGGTSVAVQLSITMGKPTYVFNQVANSTYTEGWYKWDKTKQDFVPVDTPVLTKNFAGIGTSSNTTPQGKQAIRDVYAKTLSGATTTNEELGNELPVEDNIIDDSPIVTGNKNAVIKVKPDVVAPSKFSKLVQGAANFFINSFKFKGKETTRTDDVESPLQFVRQALIDLPLFRETIPNSKYDLNKDVARAYRDYLGEYYDNLSNTLKANLNLFFSEKKHLARFEKGDPLNRFEEGKVLNITERTDKGYQYNQHLLELATLAGLQWFLTAGQTERSIEREDVAKLLDITQDEVTDELMNSFLNTSDMGQLSQSLTSLIKSFWGVSGINTEMMAYTDGIPEAMAAEVIRAFTELEMITLTKVDHPTKPNQPVNRFKVNRFDNDALYSFPTAIQEVVLIEPEDVIYFGDDIPPIPQTQLGDPTIKLSRKEKKAVAAANKTEVRTNVLQANVIMSLSEDDLKIMFGGGIESKYMNKNTLASVQGKNKTILNAYQAMVDLLSKVNNVATNLDIDDSQVVMRFPHTITAVGRLMMLGKYNIQSTKLLREVFLPTWSTLDLQSNQDHIDAFHLAVAQALGIKVHNDGPNSIDKLRVLLSGSLAPAIEMVQDWMEATDNGENPITFNGSKLAQIFKDAKEGLTPNAFHALIEYVRYQRIEDKTKFTTGLYLEADGVTNGPGNAIQMLTVGKFTGKWVTTVEKIGHSFTEPKAKHELDKNNKDLYGTAGINTIKPLQNILNNMNQSPDKEQIMSVLGSLYSLLSMNVKGISYTHDPLMQNIDLDVDRNAFKNPLTILLYGSGITGIAGKATKQMMDNIYKLFSDANILLNSKEGKNLTVAQAMFPGDVNAEQTYKKFVEDLNRIRSTTINTEYIDRKKVYVVEGVNQPVRKYGKSELQDFTFTGSEVDAITQNITKGLVEAMYQGAVETVGSTVMQSTKMIQQATQIQSILLEAAFTKAIQDKIASHKLNDPSYRAGDFISKQDFMDIMEELKVIAPYLKTPDQTFLAAKTKRYRNEKGSKIEYSRSLNDMFRTEPNVFIPTNAGVSGTPNLVIGMGDAYAILQAAIDESLVGNLWIYDGINMPLDKIADYAPKLNKAAFEAWQNNPLRVIEESFRSFMGEKSMMIKALNETLNNEDLANQLNKSLGLYKAKDKLTSGNINDALDLFTGLLNIIKNSADSIDARHAAIARMPNSVDQLAAAGVPYHNGVTVDPTLDTHEKIAEQLNKYYQEELDKIQGKPKSEPVKEMTPEEMDPITKDMLSNTVTDELSGVKILHAAGLFNLGKSINLSREQRKAYIQLVKSNKLDGYKVVFGSIEQIKKYRELYGYKFVDLDQETDNGFIDMNNKIIHLINPSVETLVHEMIHAATYGSVLNYYQNPSLNTKEVNDAIKRTEGLLGEFLNLSERELARLTPEQRTAINNVKAAMQEPATNFDNSTAQIEAKALNEFMAWSLSNQELIATFKNVKIPAHLRIAKEVIAIIKKFFTFKDKVTGEIKEEDLKVPEDLFGNLLFNASIIINDANPSIATTMAETTLFHSANGGVDHITQLRGTLMDKVVLFLNNTGQPMNISLYNSGFGKTLTEAKDTVSSLVPIFGISGVEETTLNYVVAALSTEIQVDPLTIDGIQTLYAHTVVELAKQVDAGTYPKAKYDALIGRIGNPKIINGKSTLLPVFLGLGLIDTELRDALAKIDIPTKAKNTTGTLDAGIDNFANKMLDGLFKVLTGQRKAHDVADAIELLSERLTEIALKEDSAINSPFNAPGNNADKANEWVSNNISKLGDKGLALGAKLETSNKLRVKQLGSAITILSSLASETNGETVSRAAISIVNKTNAWKPFREFITDLTNRTESNALVYDLIKKVRASVQQLRQNYRTEVPKKIAKKFTRVLSNDEWSNLFRSMAKTDLAALIDIMSKEEILDLFTNPNSLNKQISSLENRIQNQDTTNWSLYQTKMKQLSVYMNTGVTGSNFLRNPYAIHGLLNEAKPKNFKVMGKDAVHSIDQLTTLYAIEGLSQQDKTDMAEMIKEESEALGFIIDYLVGQSAGEVLKAANNPVIQLNYYKGHIPQINKSGSSLLVATDDQMHNLKLRGYTRIGDYAGSNLDPNRIDKGYYFSTVSANTAVSQGTIQNVQKTISGVDDTYGFTVGSMVDRITDPAEVRRITVRLNKETNTIENLIPVFNGTGEVIAYERSMNPEMVAMLKPSEHLAEMIGVWRGRQIEEQIATEINKEVIDNHYTMWKNDITKKPSSQQEYVNILDPKQLDVIEQDMVSLFSFETRQYIANTYGSEFWVRKDVMNDMIGFRKASIADVFTGKTRLSKETQEVIKKVLVTAFGYEAYKYAVNSEKFIQNVTNEVRTLIIVKSVIVPMFNIASNIVQAIARGVPIKTIAKAPTKILELRSYTQSQVKQVGLEAELRAASGNPSQQKVLEAQIQAIKDGHKRLSIWPLIEAGEFSTISDIGSNSEDIDLFSGNSENWLRNKIDKLPPALKTTVRYGFMTRDTALFQGLQKMVQYGDFIAKAVMYDDLLIRKGLTKEQALGKITDEFVNYDKLPGRFRGYLEDMGVLWFWNYKLRITKVALSIMRENPINALMLSVMPIPIGSGTPMGDNFVTKLLDGSLTGSIGPGMSLQAAQLTPVYNILN